MKLRVVHVDTETGWRGGQVQLDLLLRATTDRWEHHLVVPEGSPWGERAPPGVSVHEVRLHGRWWGRGALQRTMERLRPERVALHTAHALALVPPRWPTVVHRRVDFVPSRWALRRLRRVARVLAVSDGVAEVLRSRGVERVSVVYDGVSHDVPWAQPPGHQRVLAVGALVPHKDHDTLLRAMAHVKAPLDLVGQGPLQGRLEALVARLGLHHRVRLLGQVPDVPQRLASATTLVHSSREEGLGQVVLEAMARGVPVVASRVGGLVDAVAGDGLLVPPGDPLALAAGLRTMLREHPRFRRHLWRRRSARAARFGVQRMVDDTVAAYVLAG